MTRRRDQSMLEAFRAATSRSKTPAGGPFVPGASPGGRDAAPGASAEPREAKPRAAAPAAAPAALRSSPAAPAALRSLTLFAALGVAFVIGVVVGRGTAGEEVEAGEPGAVAAEPADPPARAAGTGALPPTPPVIAVPDVPDEVRPLYDARNKYTVVAAAYPGDKEQYAWDSHDHLAASGLPVFPPFRTPNGMLVLVVGAAPLESELAPIRDRLRSLPGPGGGGTPYGDAYAYPIRKLLGPNENG